MATMVPPATTGIGVSVEAGNSSTHYVDWAAIIGGVFVAMAISSVFLAFGSALGLSLTSFQDGNTLPATGLVIAAGLWLLWVQVSGFMGGGYIAGRMRRRIGDGTPHEAEMRDGAHGLFVWAVGVVIGALMAAYIALAGAAGVANVAGEAAGQAAANPGAMDYYVDRLLRATPGTASTTTPTATPGTGSDGQSQTRSQEISRVLTMSVGRTTVDDADRSYLASEVSARTGLPQAEAEQRVDETVATLKAQADKARRYGILLAFLTAASLLISAVAAWWAACAGGQHRNEGTDHSRFTRWR